MAAFSNKPQIKNNGNPSHARRRKRLHQTGYPDLSFLQPTKDLRIAPSDAASTTARHRRIDFIPCERRLPCGSTPDRAGRLGGRFPHGRPGDRHPETVNQVNVISGPPSYLVDQVNIGRNKGVNFPLRLDRANCGLRNRHRNHLMAAVYRLAASTTQP